MTTWTVTGTASAVSSASGFATIPGKPLPGPPPLTAVFTPANPVASLTLGGPDSA